VVVALKNFFGRATAVGYWALATSFTLQAFYAAKAGCKKALRCNLAQAGQLYYYVAFTILFKTS
jgi:hypothetical protein